MNPGAFYTAKAAGANTYMAIAAGNAATLRDMQERERADKARAEQQQSNAALAESNRATKSAAAEASEESSAARRAAENAASESRKLRTQMEKQAETEEDRRKARNLLVEVSLLLDELKAKHP